MTHLFDLPEYDDAFDCFIHRTVHELMRQKDPILSTLPVEYAEAVMTSQNTMPSGEVVESRPFKFRMPLTIEFDEVIIGRSLKLIEAIDNAAEEGLKLLMPQFFGQLGQVSTAAGTSTDAKGQPLTWALIFAAWEKLEIEFDEHGKPILSMVMGPETHRQYQSLPPLTHEEQRALNELLKRKRAAFDARQRRRKLS